MRRRAELEWISYKIPYCIHTVSMSLQRYRTLEQPCQRNEEKKNSPFQPTIDTSQDTKGPFKTIELNGKVITIHPRILRAHATLDTDYSDDNSAPGLVDYYK